MTRSAADIQAMRERIDRAWYTMNGLDKLVAAVPQDARACLAAGLADAFGLDAPGSSSDADLKAFLVTCRLKLDVYRDPFATRRRFVDLVSDALVPGAARATESADHGVVGDAATRTLSDRTVPTSPIVASAAPAGAPPRDAGILFPQGDRPRAALPRAFARLLLPAPADSASLHDNGRWVSGEPWSPVSVGLWFSGISERDETTVLEAEAEIAAAPEAFVAAAGVIVEKEPGPWPTARRLVAAARAAGIGVDAGEGLRLLARAYADAFRVVDPGGIDEMASLGAQIVAGPAACEMASAVHGLEGVMLKEEDVPGEGHQILLGSPRPEGPLLPGMALCRGAILHALTGLPPEEAMREGLAEVRYAQVLRQADLMVDPVVALEFDAIFERDCLTSLDAYRIAKKEMEPDIA